MTVKPQHYRQEREKLVFGIIQKNNIGQKLKLPRNPKKRLDFNKIKKLTKNVF